MMPTVVDNRRRRACAAAQAACRKTELHFDTRKESRRRAVMDLLVWALASPVELVVITGGEPLIQQPALIPLVRALPTGGKRVEIETNGTVIPDADRDGRYVVTARKGLLLSCPDHRPVVDCSQHYPE
jgi:organic radical activating enzyme